MMIGKVYSKFFLAMALVMALAFSAVSLTPATAEAKTFNINRNGQIVTFNVSGKGGLIKKKNFSLTITNNGPDPIRIILGYDQGTRINSGHSHTIDFSDKGKINVVFKIQTDGGRYGRTSFDVSSGSLSID